MKGLLGLINILNLVAKPTHIFKKAKKILKKGTQSWKIQYIYQQVETVGSTTG